VFERVIIYIVQKGSRKPVQACISLFLATSISLIILFCVQGGVISGQAWHRDTLLPQNNSLATQERLSGDSEMLSYPLSVNEQATSTPVPATIHEEPVIIPAYPYEPHLNDVYTALHNMTFKRLSWSAYNKADKALIDRAFTGIILENEYLKLTVLPELGGRLYECVFKATGHNEFYQNPVLKPTHWGPRGQGWWLAAGGIEWCLPVEEHGYTTGVPWDFSTVQSSEGVTVTVRDSTDDDRLRAQVDIHLPSGKAYFTISPRLQNPTDHVLNYKFWLNAMLSPGGTNDPSDQSQFIYPTDQMTVHSRDENWIGLPGPGEGFAWPIQQDRDLSVLGNWPYYLGCFERPVATGDFVGLYDHQVEEGIVRIFPSEVARGAKAFSFGYGEGALPPSLWTDDVSSYLEIHGGVAPTFDDYATLLAGEQLTWTEHWYPVKDIGGVVYANRQAALNLEITPEGAWIGLATTARYERGTLSLKRRVDGSSLFQETMIQVTPSQPYLAGPIPVGSLRTEDLSCTYTDRDGKAMISYN
jgi:hypothetical protein